MPVPHVRHGVATARLVRPSRLVLAAALLLAPGPGLLAAASAQETEPPVLLTADEVGFDEALGIVTARGNVEVTREGRIVRADVVTYNQRTEVITATGNVILVEPDGDVLFSEYAELTDDLAEGFLDGVAVLFADDSRAIGTSGRRFPEGVTELNRAVYSPCALCEENPRQAPLWQLRAVRVEHDREARDVRYYDAFLDLFGIPVAYTPFFSHPDPAVERRSGFLAPVTGVSSELGPFFGTSYYIDIAPEQDATLDLVATTDSGALIGGEYRRRLAAGAATVSGSVNVSDREEIGPAGEELILEDEFRWHVFSNARYDIDRHWRATLGIERASDDTYLDTFDISDADVLTSRAAAEGFYGLSFASAELFSFQDLRQGSIGQPEVVPWLNYHYTSGPRAVAGGQLLGYAGLLNLLRPAEVETPVFPAEGVDTRRVSFGAEWRRERITDLGLVWVVSGGFNGDIYDSDDVPEEGTLPDDTLRDDVFEARVVPRATATARYPLVRQAGGLQQLIEPVVSVSAATTPGGDEDIPNNDSIDVEFDEINLFADNRFPGRDRIDGGLRLTYGLRAGLFRAAGGAATLFLGQSLRSVENDEFPEDSGLEEELSDIVGRLEIKPSPLLDLDYRFRLDQDSFAPRRQEAQLAVGPQVFKVAATYLNVDAVGEGLAIDDTKEVRAAAVWRATPFWTLSGSYRFDIDAAAARKATFGATYRDECFLLSTVLERDFTNDRDVATGTSLVVRLVFRNLGELPFEVSGADLFPAGDE